MLLVYGECIERNVLIYGCDLSLFLVCPRPLRVLRDLIIGATPLTPQTPLLPTHVPENSSTLYRIVMDFDFCSDLPELLSLSLFFFSLSLYIYVYHFCFMFIYYFSYLIGYDDMMRNVAPPCRECTVYMLFYFFRVSASFDSTMVITVKHIRYSEGQLVTSFVCVELDKNTCQIHTCELTLD